MARKIRIIEKNAKNGNDGKKGVGNTTAKARQPPCRRWCFTFFNYGVETLATFLEGLELKEAKYVFQEEECPTTKKMHLQGFIVFPKITRPKEYFNWTDDISWRKMGGSIKQNIIYCTKVETRKGRQWSKGYDIEPIKIIDDEKLYKWQQEIVDIIKGEVDERKIFWYWETKGGVGKSSFCKYLVVKYKALVLSGKGADMKYAITCMKEKPKIILIDIPRSAKDFVSYGAIEEVKNGLFFSGKYESKQLVMNSPHIICFANFEPNYEVLSMDRWMVKKIYGEVEDDEMSEDEIDF